MYNQNNNYKTNGFSFRRLLGAAAISLMLYTGVRAAEKPAGFSMEAGSSKKKVMLVPDVEPEPVDLQKILEDSSDVEPEPSAAPAPAPAVKPKPKKDHLTPNEPVQYTNKITSETYQKMKKLAEKDNRLGLIRLIDVQSGDRKLESIMYSEKGKAIQLNLYNDKNEYKQREIRLNDYLMADVKKYEELAAKLKEEEPKSEPPKKEKKKKKKGPSLFGKLIKNIANRLTLDGSSRNYLSDGDNFSTDNNLGASIFDFTKINFNVGKTGYGKDEVFQGSINDVDYSQEDNTVMSSFNLGGGLLLTPEASEILLAFQRVTDKMDINSVYNEDVSISEVVSGELYNALIHTNQLDSIKIKNKTDLLRAGVARTIFGNSLKLGLYGHYMKNNSQSNTSMREYESGIESLTYDSTMSNGFDTTLFIFNDTIPATLTDSKDEEIRSEQKIITGMPSVFWNWGPLVLGGAGIYSSIKEIRDTVGVGDIKTSSNYKAGSVNFGIQFWKLFSSSFFGASSDFENLRVSQTFYLSDEKPGHIVTEKISGIQSNLMMNDLERMLAAATSQKQLGQLGVGMHPLSIIDQYGLMRDLPDFNQLTLDYEKVDRFDLEGEIMRVAAALKLVDKGNKAASFVAEGSKIHVTGDPDDLYSMLAGIMGKFGSWYVMPVLKINMKGDESVASAGLTVGLKAR